MRSSHSPHTRWSSFLPQAAAPQPSHSYLVCRPLLPSAGGLGTDRPRGQSSAARGELLPLRLVLGLLHGDLIDVRQGPGTGGAFDGLDGDILHLLLGLSELFLERGNLSGVASESLLERLCAQFCQALFCLGILFRENHLVLEPGLHLLARLQRRCFDLLLEARGKRLDLVLEPRQLLLLLQGRIANCLVFSKASCCSRFFPRTQLLIVLVLRLLFSRFFRYS